MPNTLVIQLDDADYNALKRVAHNEGTKVETWLLNTVRGALADTPFGEKYPGTVPANGWPDGFFEATYGSLADDPLDRLLQREPEVRERIR